MTFSTKKESNLDFSMFILVRGRTVQLKWNQGMWAILPYSID